MEAHNDHGCVVTDGIRRHEFADRQCPSCGTVFCHTCCGWTNRHHGGKHQPDSTHCPRCGRDVDVD